MKKRIFLSLLLVIVCAIAGQAQHVGVTLTAEASKTFKIKSKWRIRLGQRLQLNPEIERFESLYDGLFNEIYPFPASDDDESDDDDDDDEISGANGNSGASDAPYDIKMEWRTASSFRGEYRPLKWIRIAQSYILNAEAGELRHAFRSDLGLTLLDIKKLKLDQRFSWQSVSEQRKSGTRWNKDMSCSLNMQWEFKKKHTLFLSPGLNARFKNREMQWDRLRIQTGLKYAFSKSQSFSFGYLFQQRLSGSRKGDTSHGLAFTYALSF